MFFALVMVCNAAIPEECNIVAGRFFPSYDSCMVDLATNGMAYISSAYDRNIHIAFIDCLDADIQGEPA